MENQQGLPLYNPEEEFLLSFGDDYITNVERPEYCTDPECSTEWSVKYSIDQEYNTLLAKRILELSFDAESYAYDYNYIVVFAVSNEWKNCFDVKQGNGDADKIKLVFDVEKLFLSLTETMDDPEAVISKMKRCLEFKCRKIAHVNYKERSKGYAV